MFHSHGYNGIFRITHIANYCTGETIVSRPIARNSDPKGIGEKRWKGLKYEWNRVAYQRSCWRQKSYVRPIQPKRFCASGYSYFNASKRNGRLDDRKKMIDIYRHSVKSSSRVSFKIFRDLLFFYPSRNILWKLDKREKEKEKENEKRKNGKYCEFFCLQSIRKICLENKKKI